MKKFILLTLFIILFSTSIKAEEDYLGQDLSCLKDSNGKIVELNSDIIKLEDYDSNIDTKKRVENLLDKYNFYRINYLSDGLRVVGYMVKPKKEGKYPVIIWNRGGNREFAKITKNELVYFSQLASRGYVVIASQYRGNDGGEGKEEFGGKDINDVLNLIPLVKSLPFTDNNKIVMFGVSRGGMMTYLAIKKGADIKAAVIDCGPTDLIQTYNERNYVMRKVLEELIGGSPREMKDEYIKRSAYYWPEKIEVPVLILHGKFDQKVKVSQAEKLAKKLEELDKEYKLILYNDSHGIIIPSNWKKWNKEMFKWFDKYLND
ncbi:prolyl oligopeptidase family protein [Orenia metallireducens]|uniref:Prolyl oligopeptidase family protein n=1 Tax=Orenia metallireducens TaxID=1413210 RepID=A0A285HYR2_9FIRM|nr:prolyl oligopeptidase family serine peptidase [Orenia metallireducens]PRX29298.1 prolyl oligopeptidase family protein [Orenia metallireducens]SNY40773.1 Prolyl oligopeptidase family protein [Orenia metallireducens]